MPTIARFRGISILMFVDDHVPPHFHAEYGEHKGKIRIGDGDMFEGWIPNPKNPFVRVRAVKHLEGFVARITFTDGTVRDIDLEKYLHGPAFESIRSDPEMFRRVFVGDGRTLAWPSGADIDPDVLYYDLTPVWMERETEHAT